MYELLLSLYTPRADRECWLTLQCIVSTAHVTFPGLVPDLGV